MTIFLKFLIVLSFTLFFQINASDLSDSKAPKSKKKINIVMLGNSITHGGKWNKLLKRSDVDEQGIVSDSLRGFLKRVEKVIELKPRFCFIMGGINDIYKWEKTREIFKTYKLLIKKLRNAGIEPIIQSTLFVAQKYPHSENRNKEVVKLNEMLKKFALIRKIKFIDLNKKMSKDKFLLNSLTWDGVHLNANGYAVWAQEIKQFLAEKKY